MEDMSNGGTMDSAEAASNVKKLIPATEDREGITSTGVPTDHAGWENMWVKGEDKIWNFPDPHRYVTDNYDKLLCGQEKVKILFPFCGKDIHMQWFAERGHEVVGIEWVETGARQFFEENEISYTSSKFGDVDGCRLFESKNPKLNIRVYVCDLMNFTSSTEGNFDAVWDRGAFGALASDKRQQFCDVMLSDGMLKPSARYIIETFAGDESEGVGFVAEESLKECFKVGTRFTMDRLVYEAYEDESDYKQEHGHGYCDDTKGCEPCPECPQGGGHAEKQGEECKYGLDHSSPDYKEPECKMMVQVHFLHEHVTK